MPAVRPFINPLFALMVATVGVALLQVPPACVELNVTVLPTHTFSVPLNTPGVGAVVTVTVAVPLLLLLSVYVIVVVPPATPVTKPVLLTVATPVFDDCHGVTAEGVPEPVNCVVPLLQIAKVPLITGFVLTVTVTLTVQPLLFV